MTLITTGSDRGGGPPPRWWEWLCYLLLAGVFGYAGVMKLVHAVDFTHVIARFDLLPEVLVNSVAITLPAIEILLAVTLLLIPALRRPALLGILIACVVFAAVLGSAIARGIPVACGCFGSGEKPSLHGAWWALARDLAMLAMTAGCYARQLRRSRHDASPPDPAGLASSSSETALS